MQKVEDPQQKSLGMTPNFMGYTLIELLVVVLIIGILASVALPQYQKAVEKARMTEAITLVRAIANANQSYYMANGVWAEHNQLDLLDIEIPGSDTMSRKQTKYFVYSPNGNGNDFIATAQRLPFDQAYSIYILRAAPDRLHCLVFANGSSTAVQRQLCNQLDANGTL